MWFAEPLWTDPDLESGISVRELISTLKSSAGGEWMVEHFLKIMASEEEATSTNISCHQQIFIKENP